MEISSSPCHIEGMAKNELKLTGLEARLKGLKAGHTLPVNDPILIATFGSDIVTAVESAKELARRNNCLLEYNLLKRSGVFKRSYD